MATLIMMRHGESLWNKLNFFTGWVDIPLSQKGIQEALEAGEKIKKYPIDIIFTSSLVRAQMTAFLAMSVHESNKVPVVMHPENSKLEEWGTIYGEEAKRETIPVVCSWELNERMYGELQGLNKRETADRFGDEQVKIWRRSYDVKPPHGESLAMTAERALPYFKEQILPHLSNGKNVLISAHGNSLRAICMYLDGLSKEQVVNLEIPTGMPLAYQFEGSTYKKVLI